MLRMQDLGNHKKTLPQLSLGETKFYTTPENVNNSLKLFYGRPGSASMLHKNP